LHTLLLVRLCEISHSIYVILHILLYSGGQDVLYGWLGHLRFAHTSKYAKLSATCMMRMIYFTKLGSQFS